MYYILRLLAGVKRVLGWLTTQTARLYNGLNKYLKKAVNNEITKAEDRAKARVERAKIDVIEATQRVLELEVRVKDVTKEQAEKVANKAFKLKTKVQNV